MRWTSKTAECCWGLEVSNLFSSNPHSNSKSCKRYGWLVSQPINLQIRSGINVQLIDFLLKMIGQTAPPWNLLLRHVGGIVAQRYVFMLLATRNAVSSPITTEVFCLLSIEHPACRRTTIKDVVTQKHFPIIPPLCNPKSQSLFTSLQSENRVCQDAIDVRCVLSLGIRSSIFSQRNLLGSSSQVMESS